MCWLSCETTSFSFAKRYILQGKRYRLERLKDMFRKAMDAPVVLFFASKSKTREADGKACRSGKARDEKGVPGGVGKLGNLELRGRFGIG